jgi:hypothetical protein
LGWVCGFGSPSYMIKEALFEGKQKLKWRKFIQASTTSSNMYSSAVEYCSNKKWKHWFKRES